MGAITGLGKGRGKGLMRVGWMEGQCECGIVVQQGRGEGAWKGEGCKKENGG